MKIELKSIVFSERLSEETNCFTANIYVDGKNVGYCKNNGCGGNTDYHFSDNELRVKVEDYCKTLPDVTSGTFTWNNSLEWQIDSLFEQWLDKKHEAKMQKDYNKGICFGQKNHYHIINWGKWTINDLLKNPTDAKMVKAKVDSLVAEGKTILNTNLPKDWVLVKEVEIL